MLSRVADNLYWMSRYLERAEHTARVLQANMDVQLDRPTDSSAKSWQLVLESLHVGDSAESPPPDATAIVSALTVNANHDASIIASIEGARRNARQVRELISSEMWEQINRLYLTVSQTAFDTLWVQPHDFFQAVIKGALLFRGLTDATMNHGEGWHFIQVGQLLERVVNLTGLLKTYLGYWSRHGRLLDDPSPAQYLDWMTLLHSCAAFEAYTKEYTADLRFHHIAEFLLLSEQFPHSIHFAIRTMQEDLNAIAAATGTHRNTRVYRLIGRLRSQLSYDEIGDVIAAGLTGYLDDIHAGCLEIDSAIYQTYIMYAVEDKLLNG